MSEAEIQRVTLGDFNAIPDLSDVDYSARPEDEPPQNGLVAVPPIVLETWLEFSSRAEETIPCIVEGLWPEGSLGFVGSAPKKGKTWLALSLALSVATGRHFLNIYPVSRARKVLYLALEGHRASLKTRIGCLSRGIGQDPDQEIPNLHFTYKPRGLNIANPVWAQHVIDASNSIGAELVIVDVLRAAALIKENAQEDFAALRSNLAELLEDGRSLAFLHHFTKVSETSKERTPGERMSGSGAMYGALDIGVFITGSEHGARKLRLEFDGRDIAMPEPLGVELSGHGTGQNGGFSYHDRAVWSHVAAPERDDISAPAEDIVSWLIENGGEATESEVALAFEVTTRTIFRRRLRLEELGVEFRANPGKVGTYKVIHTPDTTHDRPMTRNPGQLPLSGVEGLEQAETTHDTTPLTNADVIPDESADLQGFSTPDTPDSPTGRASLVSEPAHPEPADDDIPF